MDFIYNTTTPSDGATIERAVSSLSEGAFEVLSHIATTMVTEDDFNPENGVYVESDSFECKQFNTADCDELIEAGVIYLKPNSKPTALLAYVNLDIIELVGHEYPMDAGYTMDQIEDMLERVGGDN